MIPSKILFTCYSEIKPRYFQLGDIGDQDPFKNVISFVTLKNKPDILKSDDLRGKAPFEVALLLATQK